MVLDGGRVTYCWRCRPYRVSSNGRQMLSLAYKMIHETPESATVSVTLRRHRDHVMYELRQGVPRDP